MDHKTNAPDKNATEKKTEQKITKSGKPKAAKGTKPDMIEISGKAIDIDGLCKQIRESGIPCNRKSLRTTALIELLRGKSVSDVADVIERNREKKKRQTLSTAPIV